VRRWWVVLGVVGTACAPRLYSDAIVDTTWVAPNNSWRVSTPPDGLVGQGLSVGQTAVDIRGVDQFGDEVSLWQFYGRHVLIDLGTLWCGPCRELAMGTEALNQEFLDEDVVYLTVLLENNEGDAPTVEELNLWASLPSYHPDPEHPYDLITAPVIADPKGVSGSSLAIRQNNYPVALLVGPDMQVIERIEPVSEARIEEVLAEAVGHSE
jgi:thiol-disulfide isomerase/thioredoxin